MERQTTTLNQAILEALVQKYKEGVSLHRIVAFLEQCSGVERLINRHVEDAALPPLAAGKDPTRNAAATRDDETSAEASDEAPNDAELYG